ncbi:MAG TPA: ABC transporter substrate-binding protein, partial [Aggregatilineaceae bacterium]|nr:ABC transporter substrate-binding protein [Aggregatilineaceae bacterium]
WDPHNEMDLVKNATYWGTAPATFDKIIVRDIPKAATQKDALQAGDLDVAFDLNADQSASIKSDSNLKLYESASATVFFLLMNQDKTIGGPMSNPKVQRAVRLALDYQGILKLAGGSAVTPPSVIPVGFVGAWGTDKALKRDVAGAKKLLADAGVTNATVDLEYAEFTYQGVNFGTLAQKIKADLADVGITVNLKPGEIQVVLANYRDGKEGFSLWWWDPDYIDAIDYVEFLPEGTVGKRAKWTDANDDADIKGYRDSVTKEVDVNKRVDLFGKIQQYLQDKGPFAPLLQPGIQIGYRADLKGIAYNYEWTVDLSQLTR